MTEQEKTGLPIVVVGGGITGLTAALEAAEAGHQVVLVERNSYLGGRVAQFYHYFPKLCPPQCGLEINFKRLRGNPRVTVHTLATVTRIEGQPGDLRVTILKKPRFVREDLRPTAGELASVTTTVDDAFNFGLKKVKAVHVAHELAYPNAWVMEPCLLGTPEADQAKAALGEEFVDLTAKEAESTIAAAAVIWATGWSPYDPKKLTTYHFGQSPDLISNVQMERLAAPGGPTGGKVVRLSDGQPPKSVAFVQCAGSRDENHLPFCSTVCCLASLKQATYVREQLPEAEVTIYFIDIRAMDRDEDFYAKVKKDPLVKFVKSKIAKINPVDGRLCLEGENTTTGEKFTATHDLVVLATGMQPNTATEKVPAEGLAYDDYGFLRDNPGVIPAGCSKAPRPVAYCVQAGAAAALKAIQAMGRR